MAHSRSGKPYPSRWAMIYLLVLALAAIAWIIRCAVFGGTPWTHPW